MRERKDQEKCGEEPFFYLLSRWSDAERRGFSLGAIRYVILQEEICRYTWSCSSDGLSKRYDTTRWRGTATARLGTPIPASAPIFNFHYVDGENSAVLEMWEPPLLVDLIVMNVGLVICQVLSMHINGTVFLHQQQNMNMWYA